VRAAEPSQNEDEKMHMTCERLWRTVTHRAQEKSGGPLPNHQTEKGTRTKGGRILAQRIEGSIGEKDGVKPQKNKDESLGSKGKQEGRQQTKNTSSRSKI